MRKIDQGRGEWMSRLSQGRLSSLSIWSQDHYDQVPSHLPSHPGHLSMCLTITLTKYSHTGIEPPAPRQVHHEEKVTPPTECQEHLSVRTSASGRGRNPPRVTLWICRCVTSQEPGALPSPSVPANFRSLLSLQGGQALIHLVIPSMLLFACFSSISWWVIPKRTFFTLMPKAQDKNVFSTASEPIIISCGQTTLLWQIKDKKS